MDAASKSLDHVLKSGEFTVFKDVPIFDEHSEYDAEGKLVRKFDKKALQKIVDECNRRAQETGDLSPFGPGHTVADAPEHLQPVTYGYAADFKVGDYGPKKKLGILASFYVKNKVRTPDGKEADGVQEFKSYPRRSIELWLKDGFIDHIALLRRTPQRDLGLMAFGKAGEKLTYPAINNFFNTAKKDYSLAAAVRGGKLCYAMEPQMPLDTPAVGVPSGSSAMPGGGDDEYQKFCAMCDRYMKDHFGDNLAKYMVQGGQGEGDMPPNPTEPPIAKPEGDDDLVKMAKQFAGASDQVKVAQFHRLLKRVSEIESGQRSQMQQFSKDDAAQRVANLVTEGIILDPAKEQVKFEKLPLGKDRDDYASEIKQYYQRDFFNAARPYIGNIPTVAGNNGGPKRFSKQDIDRAVERCAKSGEDYTKVLAEIASTRQ